MAYYRGTQSPRDEQQHFPNPLSPPQRTPNRWSGSMTGLTDVRGPLLRRFTTSTVPTLSPIGQQRRQAMGDVQPPSERAARHYENLLQAQRKIQEELEKVDAETRREVDENLRHEQAVTQIFAQSEPTTPPEYQSIFQNNRPRSNRYSVTSFTSPPGIVSRPNRSSTQLTSPSTGSVKTYPSSNTSNLPSQSVPGSRRQSDDEEEDDFVYTFDASNRRAGANPNRNSMPITAYDHKRSATDIPLGALNTTSFLFDADEQTSNLSPKPTRPSPPDTKTFLQVQHTADGFPKLIRREENGDRSLPTASAALDLASSSQNSELQAAERAAGNRHRISLPPSALSGGLNIAPLNSILANTSETPPAANNRRSMEVKFTAETKRPTLMASPPRGLANGVSMPPSSYSTNDIPTLKTIKTEGRESGVGFLSPPAQHSALSNTTSREPASGVPSLTTGGSRPQTQDLSSPTMAEDGQNGFHDSQSVLQANALPFGPLTKNNGHLPDYNNSNMSSYDSQPFYSSPSMHIMNNGLAAMNLGGPGSYGPQWPNQMGSMFQPNGYGGYQQYLPGGGQAVPGAARYDNQRVTMQQRRQAAEEAQAKFNSIDVDQLVGEIYTLCKDQHGCRFLQKKLEERNEQTVQIIFEDVKTHMIDLMIDPFGNYLCQKLLESANDEQRTALIRNAMPAMTKIALNQHGTRALQKMIEFISNPEQTALIIEALRNDVVLLIQDLNGNHVIQKCLNHLSSEDAQFIFDAVGANCVTVGTHRHGCCVLQRCIDHADGLQKGQMVNHVINNAHALVQDPFGNYVVQYIIDLAEPCFTEPLCGAFLGDIATLSRQKFSSNVIEKCIRCSGPDTKRAIVREIMAPPTLEKLLRDGFANYVVQTAMDFSDEETKIQLVENVRSILPIIRNTPHGRRIQSKISEYDSRSGTAVLTPLESTSSPGSVTYVTPPSSAPRSNRRAMVGAPPQWSGTGGFASGGSFDMGNYSIGGYGKDGVASPTPQRSNRNYGLFNGNQNYPNYGYGNSSFSGPVHQPYGQL